MEKNLLLIFILFAHCFSGAQSLSPFIISSSGNFSSSGNVSLSSTVGESSMIQTFASPSAMLTQGFQQPNDFLVFINQPENNIRLNWYPNPSNGLVSLEGNFPFSGKLSLKVMDNIGKAVYLTERNITQGLYTLNISLLALPDGVYQIETTLINEHIAATQKNILSIIH